MELAASGCLLSRHEENGRPILRVGRGRDVIRSRIVGAFREWGPNTSFRFENGQVWVVDGDSESRSFGARENAEIEIRPANSGTRKLFLLPDGLWVRVERVQ